MTIKCEGGCDFGADQFKKLQRLLGNLIFGNKTENNQIKKSHLKSYFETTSFFCDPSGVRTQDPNIKSVVLYQLS